MRRIVISLAGFAIVICSVAAAEKDTQAATKTRKKLLAKVTVDFKDEMLKECIAEISRQLEDAQAGSLSATYDTGRIPESAADIRRERQIGSRCAWTAC